MSDYMTNPSIHADAIVATQIDTKESVIIAFDVKMLGDWNNCGVSKHNLFRDVREAIEKVVRDHTIGGQR